MILQRRKLKHLLRKYFICFENRVSKIKGVLTILEDRSKNNNILLHESPIINKKNYFNLFVSDIALMEKKKSLAIIEIYDSIFAFEEIRSYLTKNKNLRDKVDAKQRNNLQDFNVEEQMYKANEDAYIEKIREINKHLLPVLEVIENYLTQSQFSSSAS